MNILIIPAFFQTKRRPTLGSFFVEQAKALIQQGHKVTILYCDTYSVKCINEWIKYEEGAKTQEFGIKIYRKKSFCPLKHGIEGYCEAFAKGITELYEKYVKNEKFDIIHAHCCVWAGYAAMKLSQKINVPYIITEHATLFQLHRDEISRKNNEKIKQSFKNANKVICVSKAFSKLLSEYRDDIAVVGNVVDCNMFKPQKGAKCSNKSSMFKFLTICFMDEEAQLYKKGIDILLKAWKSFVIKYPMAKLTIGGDGNARQKSMEWVENYNIQDSVEFVGALNREQVVQYMQECDCFVLPSRYETFGVVYIEAMACGKPVIAVKNGGPDDFIEEFNGILIDAENVNELETAMKNIVENIDVYNPVQISEYIKDKFSAEAIAKQLKILYNDVLNG